VRFGDGPYDREAEPRASTCGARRHETAEELRLDVLGNRALAHHAHGDAARLAANDDVGRAARLPVHDGVVDQVVDGTRELVLVLAHDRAVFEG